MNHIKTFEKTLPEASLQDCRDEEKNAIIALDEDAYTMVSGGNSFSFGASSPADIRTIQAGAI